MSQQDSICHFFIVCVLYLEPSLPTFISNVFSKCGFWLKWFYYMPSHLSKNLFLNYVFVDEFYNLFMHLNLYLIQLSQFSNDLPCLLIFYPIHLYVFLTFLVQCWLYVRHIQASRMMTMKSPRPRQVGIWNDDCCSDYIK